MATVARLLVGWSLVAWAVWLLFEAWPEWNGLPVLILCIVAFVVIEWPDYRRRWSRPVFFPPHSTLAARVGLVVLFVTMQGLVAVLAVGSLYPSWLGNPDGYFFLPLVFALVLCGVIYRIVDKVGGRSRFQPGQTE